MVTPATECLRQTETRPRTLRICGLVQGVGFRPAVWHLATTLELTGNVRNDGRGVLINIYADAEMLKRFKQKLRVCCPPLARIDSIDEVPTADTITNEQFKIIQSTQTEVSTGIIADAATCPDCLQELKNSKNRKHYRYPFLNCTHCGPRFSIIQKLPYDRSNTSMSVFKLCDSCSSEYENPADRRFHAQPTACSQCGPQTFFTDKAGKIITSDHAITEAAKQIKLGKIIAIKGIGGFHLACDAKNQLAITRLRQKKNRPHKPLALMAKNITQIRHYAKLSNLEEETLKSPAAPIMILDAIDTSLLPDEISPDQKQWGFMLPHSPLHHLLMEELEQPVVLTSGNRSNEPQCTDNDDAITHLNNIADYFLFHDRKIVNRIDDSVAREMDGKIQLLRRARGYAPGQIHLPEGFTEHPPVLAFGGELKSTFCLLKDGQAILSQHMGNLEDARTYDDYQKNISLYLALYEHNAKHLAVDRHPEYLSTKLGTLWAQEQQLPLSRIQHHHAHIAACMIDNNIKLDEEPVIGVVFDGLGLGDDGTLWGGEFLLADYRQYKRLAHLKSVAMPGGGQAMREPWRNTWAQLDAAFGWQIYEKKYAGLKLSQRLNEKPVKVLQQMLKRSINSPLSSSAGRLFDAIAAATGLAPAQCSYEGQAAIRLEACLDKNILQQATPYPFEQIRDNKDTLSCPYEINPAAMWHELLEDLDTGTATEVIAARFHLGLARTIINTASELATKNAVNRVALSGGVFQNKTLLQLVSSGLEKNNIQVLTHHLLPANDGSIAIGQAVITAARSITR